jgi:puromycin-sensitive aminopeptidase
VEALKVIDAYQNEDNYTVWASITNCLMKLQLLLAHTDTLDCFNSYGIRMYQPVADRLGWDAKPEESHLDTLLRALVLNRLVSFKCPKTLAEAKRR